MTLSVRFSLVMQINQDVYECNKILSLDYPHFLHCIIVYTLTNQNTYFCQNSIRLCVSVANHPQLKTLTSQPTDSFQHNIIYSSPGCESYLYWQLHKYSSLESLDCMAKQSTQMKLFISAPYICTTLFIYFLFKV